jgi:glycosyltransferase involved in cell wall biosynthesis
MSTPKVSVVTATYNRSAVLRYAIESVRAQTFSGWELIVVGDACTDDTEEVVRSFADDRIRFVNLPVNSGEQATPNNEGVRLAHGEFVAFLNHDDLWTRDHLATCLGAIGEGGFLSTLTLFVATDDERVHLFGAGARGEYELGNEPVPASSWFLRRTLALALPWRPARELHAAPSEEWLYRAWKAGHRLRSVSRATVIAIPSGTRRNSYVQRESVLHARYAELLRDEPEVLVERLMTAAAAQATLALRGFSLRLLLKNLMRRITVALGVQQHSLQHALHFQRKGGYLDSLRRLRGLPPLPREHSR